MSGELSTIVTADMTGWTLTLEQIDEDGQHIIALEVAMDMDRQALAAMLIDDDKRSNNLRGAWEKAPNQSYRLDESGGQKSRGLVKQTNMYIITC